MGILYRKKKERLNKFTHFLAAFILLLHGYEKFEDEHFTAAILFTCCGLIFLSVALLHRQLHHKVRSVDAIFAFLEGIAALTLATDFWGNKHYLQFAYIIVALIYITRSITLFLKGTKHQPAY